MEKERLPTPVFWPGEFHGLYSPRGHKESDTTERVSLSRRESRTEPWGPPILGSQGDEGIKQEIRTGWLERQDQQQACAVPWKLKEESGSGGKANC